jgi:hypothetical protein
MYVDDIDKCEIHEAIKHIYLEQIINYSIV